MGEIVILEDGNGYRGFPVASVDVIAADSQPIYPTMDNVRVKNQWHVEREHFPDMQQMVYRVTHTDTRSYHTMYVTELMFYTGGSVFENILIQTMKEEILRHDGLPTRSLWPPVEGT